MSHLDIVLINDCTSGSGDIFKMFLNLDEEDDVWIQSVNEKDNSNHDFLLEKEDYLRLRSLLDNHFNL